MADTGGYELHLQVILGAALTGIRTRYLLRFL